LNWLKCRNFWLAAGVVLLLPFMARGQSHSAPVTINARVSETVAISVGEAFAESNVRIESHGAGKTLGLTLSGSSTDVVAVRLPILIRSNTSYGISALVRSQAATLVNLAVIGARPTGRFAALDAAASLNVARELDSRSTNGRIQNAFMPLNLSSSFSILSGPRVSLAGTLSSIDNALEVTLLIAAKSEANAGEWTLHLILTASPGNDF
jgi:hypothetical protein